MANSSRRVGALSFLAAVLALTIATDGYGHGGGLDSIGCHREGWTSRYHCHQGPLANQQFNSMSDAMRALRNRQQQYLKQGRQIPGAIVGRALVIDGDTIEISGIRIRLHGIDAPESDQVCYREGRAYGCGRDATLALLDKLRQQTVACRQRDVDRYRRIVAVCGIGSEDVNAWMVQQGWAVAYRRFSQDYVPHEQDAQTARRGLWRGPFKMPWRWRAERR
jgi:endonuclease YncB( thermonuclease family)